MRAQDETEEVAVEEMEEVAEEGESLTEGSPPTVALPFGRLECAVESSLRSVEGVTPTRIRFSNQTGQVVQLHWLDYAGQRQPWGAFSPGEARSQETFATHVWIITNTTGRCLVIYVAAESPFDVVIGPIDASPAVVPTATPITGPGAILLSDNFDDPLSGRLRARGDEAGYRDGEYFIRQSRLDSAPVERLPGSYADASIAVDVRLVEGQAAHLLCREQPGFVGGYWFAIDLVRGNVIIRRFPGVAGAAASTLVNEFSSAIRRGTASNRLELTCAGSRITASVNGTVVAAVDDGTYREGRMWIGAGFGGVEAITEARFDNLVVTQR